jgi:hypothetical protein
MITGDLVKPRRNIIGVYYIGAGRNVDSEIFFYKTNKLVRRDDVYVYVTNIKWGGTDYSMLLLGDQMVYLYCGEVDPI